MHGAPPPPLRTSAEPYVLIDHVMPLVTGKAALCVPGATGGLPVIRSRESKGSTPGLLKNEVPCLHGLNLQEGMQRQYATSRSR